MFTPNGAWSTLLPKFQNCYPKFVLFGLNTSISKFSLPIGYAYQNAHFSRLWPKIGYLYHFRDFLHKRCIFYIETSILRSVHSNWLLSTKPVQFWSSHSKWCIFDLHSSKWGQFGPNCHNVLDFRSRIYVFGPNINDLWFLPQRLMLNKPSP